MDFIFIDEMRVEAHVGIFEREKVAPQTLEISLTFGVPDEAAQDDDISKTIRYDEVIERIRSELASRHFNLLETLGEYVIGLLLNMSRRHSCSPPSSSGSKIAAISSRGSSRP